MNATEKQAHRDGITNGMKHGEPINGISIEAARILYRENDAKAETGMNAEEPLIRAYWQGYREGMKRKLFMIFYNQSREFCHPKASTLLEDFVHRCLMAGFSDASIIRGLGEHYRQCEQVCRENVERVKAWQE